MARTQIVLECMNGVGGGRSSPGSKTRYVLPTDPSRRVTFINQLPDDEFDCKTQPCDGEAPIKKILARLECGNYSATLETFAENTFVELEPGTALLPEGHLDRIGIPRSKENEHHYVLLRRDDIVNFADYGLKVRVGVEEVSTSAAVTPEPEVNGVGATVSYDGAVDHEDEGRHQEEEIHVRSSLVEPNTTTANAAEGDDDTDDDDNFDDTSTALTPAVDGTPATTAHPTELTVKETPHAADGIPDTDDAGELEHYSTAQESSPLHRVNKHAVDQLDHSAAYVRETGQENADEDLGPMPKFTGNADSKKAIVRPSQLNNDATDEGAAEMDDDDIRGTAAADYVDDNPYYATLPSDPLTAQEVCAKTAQLSMKREEVLEDRADDSSDVSTNKRKAVPEEDDEESFETPAPSKKKHKKSIIVDDDETPKSSAPATRSSRRQLPKAARDTSPDDEIAVKARSKRKISPKVVITPEPRSRATGTPASTAPSSALSGKPPKVLLSHDSPLRKSASKWLKDHGSAVIAEVMSKRTHFVCVPNDSIKTAKVLRSLALGKLVVTADWIKDSKKEGKLLEPEDYIHPDLVGTISVARHKLFSGTNLFFTLTLANKVYGSGWPDIETLGKETGASAVVKGSSSDFGKFTAGSKNDTIVFGAATSDPDVPRLQQQFNCTVYHKSLLTDAIVTGELDLDDDEYKLPAGGGSAKKR